MSSTNREGQLLSLCKGDHIMETEQVQALWNDWRDRLSKGFVPATTDADFAEVMLLHKYFEHAIELANADVLFCKAYDNMVEKHLNSFYGSTRFHYSIHLLHPLFVEPHRIDQSILSSRLIINTISTRVEFLTDIVSDICKRHGREWVRLHAAYWWNEAQFVEEERDAFIDCLLSYRVYRLPDLEEWGATAVESAKRVTMEAIAEGRCVSWLNDDFGTSTVGDSSTPRVIRDRVTSLAQTLSIPLHLKDSAFLSYEFDRLQNGCWGVGNNWSLIRRTLERRGGRRWRHLVDEYPELSFMNEYRPNEKQGKDGMPYLHVPLVRLMHLRLLLESPSLSDSLRDLSHLLIPDVVQYVIGRDYVSYYPELRVHQTGERRWRARWVETTSEALSAIIIEDALQADLTTLSRVTEVHGELTPDFRVQTSANESIMFESKGSTSWATHKAQRKHALKQLGKITDTKNKEEVIWAGEGRRFAISLLASLQGADETSLVHVIDPPFAFNEMFDEQHNELARRQHFAGVLEAAQLFDAAETILKRQGAERTKNANTDHQSYSLDLYPDDEDRGDYIGNYFPIVDWARRIRYPNWRSLDNLKIFVGIKREYYDKLINGELPQRAKYLSDDSNNSSSDSPNGNPVFTGSGMLPSREFPGRSRGVFSKLSNGSLLTIEVGP